jgi:hypothetical protein
VRVTGVVDGGASSSTISRSLLLFCGVDCDKRNRGELANCGPAVRRVGGWRRDRRKGDGVCGWVDEYRLIFQVDYLAYHGWRHLDSEAMQVRARVLVIFILR